MSLSVLKQLQSVNPVFREGPDGRLTPINVYMGGMRIIDEDETLLRPPIRLYSLINRFPVFYRTFHA